MAQVGIEMMLASLLEGGSMGVADLWVHSRVIEDTLDTLLARSRAEADLASLKTDTGAAPACAVETNTRSRTCVLPSPHRKPRACFTRRLFADKLRTLLRAWRHEDGSIDGAAALANATSAEATPGSPRLVPCDLVAPRPTGGQGGEGGGSRGGSGGFLAFPAGLAFRRGAAAVAVGRGAVLRAGQVVAVTGPNGCGKSSTFAVLAAAACTAWPVALPPSIALVAPPLPPDAPASSSGIGNDDGDGGGGIGGGGGGGSDRGDEDSVVEASFGSVTWALGGELREARDVVTLAQTSYHPLFARPIDWFAATAGVAAAASAGSAAAVAVAGGAEEGGGGLCGEASDDVTVKSCPAADASPTGPTSGHNDGGHCGCGGRGDNGDIGEREVHEAARLAAVLDELQFLEPPRRVNASLLLEEHEDWFGGLSGGQRAKADFVRTVRHSLAGALRW